MANSDNSSSSPRTRKEADAHEKPMRREMYIGFAIGLAIIAVIVVAIMEARYRTMLGEPQPSAYLDEAMQEVVEAASPLPEVLDSVQVVTNRDTDQPTYDVFLRGEDGQILYHLAHQSDTLYALETGPRVGGAISFEVNLALGTDGTVTGRYRPDRGIPVGHYQAVLQKMLWNALSGYQSHTEYPLEIEPAEGVVGTDTVRRQWETVMDD